MPFSAQPFPLKCTLWLTDQSVGYRTPIGPPVLNFVPCAARSPRDRETSPLFESQSYLVEIVIALPAGTAINDLFPAVQLPGNPQVSLIELPAGSGNMYRVLKARVEARGYINVHLNAYCDRVTGPVPQS